MPVLAFPGPAAPSPPPVTVEVPEGWDVLPAGSDLLSARGTGGVGPTGRAPRAQPHRAGRVLGHRPRRRAGRRRARPGTEVEESFVVEIAGREWVARNITWDDSSGPVIEVHLTTTVEPDDEGQVSRLVVVIGRVRGATLDDDYDVLQSVLETLVVGGAR